MNQIGFLLLFTFLFVHLNAQSSKHDEDEKIQKVLKILRKTKHGGLAFSPPDADIASILGATFKMFPLEEETLEDLHSVGVTFNEEDKLGRSLLFYAIEGNWELKQFKKLVELGADIHHLDKDKQNIFVQVIYRNIPFPADIAEFILSQGLSPLKADIRGDSLLSVSARFRDKELIDTLLNSGMDVNAVDEMGTTLLKVLSVITFQNDYKEMEDVPPLMEYLIGKGASVHVVDSSTNQTLLHYSSQYGSVEIMKVLLDNGANPNAISIRGNTPLHLVQPVKGLDKNESILEKVRLLLKYGAVTNVRNKEGMTPKQVLEHVLTSELAWIEMQKFSHKEEHKPKIGVDLYKLAPHDEF